MKSFSISVFMYLAISAANAQSPYTEKQMQLARQMGSVIMLSRDCGIPIPSDQFERALLSEGLQKSDVMNKTGFFATMQEQANAMARAKAVRQELGENDSDIKRWSCAQLRESYGPTGLIRRNLSDIK